MGSTLMPATLGTMATTAGLGVLAVMTLLGMLVTKEFARAGNSQRLKTLYQVLDVAIVPLVLAFLIVVVVHVLRALH